MNNQLFNLHEDPQIYNIADLMNRCPQPAIINGCWTLFWSWCNRNKMRGEFFKPLISWLPN